jgi:hypothetical protein
MLMVVWVSAAIAAVVICTGLPAQWRLLDRHHQRQGER